MDNNNQDLQQFQAVRNAIIQLPRVIYLLAKQDPDILHYLVNVGRNRSVKSKLKHLDAVVMANRLQDLYLHMHYLRDEDPDFYAQIIKYSRVKRSCYIQRLLAHPYLFNGFFSTDYTRTTIRFAVAIGLVDATDKLNPDRYIDFALNNENSAWFKSLEV